MTLEHLVRVVKRTAILLVVLFVVDCECEAIPMFARRYNVPCSTCHTSPPRLNETGYRFRAAGFRMPEELGHAVEGKLDLLDHIGFRLQPRLHVVHSSIGPNTQTENEV